MKNHVIGAFLGLSCLCNTVIADELPSSVLSVLQQRDQRLSHFSFAWQLKDEESAPPSSKEMQLAMQKSIQTLTEEHYRKAGITNAGEIQDAVQQNQQAALTAMQGFTYSSTNTWHFNRDGEETLVAGVRQLGNYVGNFRQYYNGTAGMLISDDNRFSNKEGPKSPPVVWGSTGNSILYRSLFQEGPIYYQNNSPLWSALIRLRCMG